MHWCQDEFKGCAMRARTVCCRFYSLLPSQFLSSFLLLLIIQTRSPEISYTRIRLTSISRKTFQSIRFSGTENLFGLQMYTEIYMECRDETTIPSWFTNAVSLKSEPAFPAPSGWPSDHIELGDVVRTPGAALYRGLWCGCLRGQCLVWESRSCRFTTSVMFGFERCGSHNLLLYLWKKRNSNFESFF